MQLYSVDQQRSQALEAHAASFAQFKVFILECLLHFKMLLFIASVGFIPFLFAHLFSNSCIGSWK